MGALSLLAVAPGCDPGGEDSSQDSARALGDLSLGLTLPDGTYVASVDYVITRLGVELRSGVMLVGADGRASLTITGLEPGSDYRASLQAARDGGLPCVGQGAFTIVSGQTSTANIVLQCDELNVDGNITINGGFNICPKVTSTSVSPLVVELGGSAELAAAARDRDNDSLSFTWSASAGSFSAPSSAETRYSCTNPGVHVLRVDVSDGPQRGCTRSATVMLTCVGAADAGLDASIVDAAVDTGVDASVPDAGAEYVIPSLPGVVTKVIMTVGDSFNNKPDGITPYRFVGVPDGLGAYDNNDGTFTLIANHELQATAGIVRAHGAAGAFVSRWTIRKSDLKPIKGQDLITTVQLWNKTSLGFEVTPNVAFARFCSGDLAMPGAFYDNASATGFTGRLFLSGEETGVEGRLFAHDLGNNVGNGVGTSWELPRLGKQSWENAVASPASGLKTVVVSMDDTSPLGQVFVYIGTKSNSGGAAVRAGLNSGVLYAVRVPNVAAETSETLIPSSAFQLANLGDVRLLTGAQLEASLASKNVTSFLRPEDGAWDPAHPNDFYFVTTASVTTNSRLWRLRFNDVQQPTLGGTIAAMLDGSEGHRMLDNITIDARGHILMVEDVGANERLGKIWRYTIASDSLVEIAAHDPLRFSTGAPYFLTNDEEASGIIDASGILGAGWFLFDVQAHYGITGELVEGGQLLALYDPGSL